MLILDNFKNYKRLHYMHAAMGRHPSSKAHAAGQLRYAGFRAENGILIQVAALAQAGARPLPGKTAPPTPAFARTLAVSLALRGAFIRAHAWQCILSKSSKTHRLCDLHSAANSPRPWKRLWLKGTQETHKEKTYIMENSQGAMRFINWELRTFKLPKWNLDFNTQPFQ